MDIFAKDFLFVPIHADQHWSLLIVCYAAAACCGAACASPRGHAAWGARLVGAASPCAAAPRPVILHLDSIRRTGHSTAGPAAAVRQYRADEWRARALDARGRGGVARAWADAHPDRPFCTFAAASLPATKPTVPFQCNDNDCGLFVCAFAEFFTAALSPGVPPADFLARRWFASAEVSNLRWEIHKMLLRLAGVSEWRASFPCACTSRSCACAPTPAAVVALFAGGCRAAGRGRRRAAGWRRRL